ncbi:MAG: NAD(P)-binding protein, partial [Actinomycetota bacterium]|nr:NAD(P)-binding protein [Actinomycetota bacterium]
MTEAGSTPEHVRVAVVGTGFADLGAAIVLQRAGIEHTVLERATGLGGTWRDNRYPGCRCDVPSHLYSFSFAPNPEWTETYSPQPEILEYLQRTA